jgi:hypothetical protein
MAGRALRPVQIVMAGFIPAIHVFRHRGKETRRGCPAAQTSLRSLRKLDCVAGHDEYWVMGGLDPAIHLLRKDFLRRTMNALSSFVLLPAPHHASRPIKGIADGRDVVALSKDLRGTGSNAALAAAVGPKARHAHATTSANFLRA